MPEKEMPKYKCHKEVHALKIKNIGFDLDDEDAGVIIQFEDETYASIEVDNEYIDKHEPHVGGYYVVYSDGYRSFSPADVFEAGYSKI